MQINIGNQISEEKSIFLNELPDLEVISLGRGKKGKVRRKLYSGREDRQKKANGRVWDRNNKQHGGRGGEKRRDNNFCLSGGGGGGAGGGGVRGGGGGGGVF